MARRIDDIDRCILPGEGSLLGINGKFFVFVPARQSRERRPDDRRVPALRIWPEVRSMLSIQVVFPASTCARIPVVMVLICIFLSLYLFSSCASSSRTHEDGVSGCRLSRCSVSSIEYLHLTVLIECAGIGFIIHRL